MPQDLLVTTQVLDDLMATDNPIAQQYKQVFVAIQGLNNLMACK